ncbi:MAG: hemerythrin domain-containing protein [Pseudomonadota bacterium]
MTDLPPLESRIALPDALRVLLEDYPRQNWESDPGFDGLLRFWLDRHLMFRRILKQMQTDTEKLLNNDMSSRFYAAHLSRYGGMFVQELHGHHSIEDHHYFPKLIDLDARISRGLTSLTQITTRSTATSTPLWRGQMRC